MAQLLRSARSRLRHVTVAEGAPPDIGRGAGARAQCVFGRAADKAAMAGRSAANGLRARWVLHTGADEVMGAGDVPGDGQQLVGADGPSDVPRHLDLRSVRVRLEGAVQPGCEVAVELNGVSSALRLGGGGSRARSAVAPEERRFSIAPRREAIGAGYDGSPCSSGPRQGDMETGAGRPGDALAPPAAGSEVARFMATVTVDTLELQAKTTQELKEPEIEVMEILDTAVVVRMSALTGDRFELTVYASGTSEPSSSAGTLVQRGPVRSNESVHRIGDLECNQVYVAWVRVFSENHVMESKQKGFKTLPARVRTIWDESDHVILGVASTATVKEITKAWRAKSLKFHPDKETDPDKKESAEEMMKRLNLAKQNMLRAAPTEDSSLTPGCDPTSPTSPDCPTPAPDFNMPGAPRRTASQSSSYDSDEEWFASRDEQARTGPRNMFGEDGGGGNDGEADDDGDAYSKDSLRCSLRVEALRPPKLKVITRGLTSLSVEATDLAVGSSVEVQRLVDDVWQPALPVAPVTSSTMRFTLEDLEENSSYRLRLRTVLELDPLWLTFAEFAQEETGAEDLEAEEGEEDEPGWPVATDSEDVGELNAAVADPFAEDESETST